MDINKLRPAHSQWRAPLGPVAEGRVSAKPVATEKQLLDPPKGKGGDLWTRFYTDAVSRKHPSPEKLADAMLRARERSLELKEARHKIVVTDKQPKSCEAVVANKTAAAKSRKVVHEAFRCKAKTLEGRQCGFKSTCGDFCKRHDINK